MRWLRAVAILVMLAPPVFAQPLPQDLTPPQPRTGSVPTGEETPPIETQVDYLRRAAVRLPIAAGLACVLALRPRRKGTPQRQAPVIQTQIILAVVGAVVMLVVGASLARAFGIVGAAGLVRYRAKINDPKDAGVMLSTLAVGLAAGVGLWLLASFGTLFILAMLWVVESFEPKAHQLFQLTVKGADPAALKPRIEKLLARHHIEFELRTASKEELSYEVEMPMGRKTDRLSNVILALDPENATAVEWEDKKDKNKS
jgi:uncharacterized membrane protein YhiD involved in acid resistance